ncbi:MAG: histidine phosphatase family protein [Anderseniella sp.]|nr:histidine phosphatase family protein [Anderseniella sp.]
MKQRIFAYLATLCLLVPVLLAASPRAHADEALWAALREGRAFAMMRHALAPGTGDPANFDVNDCATQRNLSVEGREQARRTGDAFRDNGIMMAEVMTSAWCRCRDTASLMNLGTPQVLPALNSFFQNRSQRDPQTEALKQWLGGWLGSRPLVLVTHQVNISALTGYFTSSGEIVVVERDVSDGVKVLGSISPQ